MASDSPVQHPEDWQVVRLSDISLKIGSGATPLGGSASYEPQRRRGTEKDRTGKISALCLCVSVVQRNKQCLNKTP